MGKMLSRRQMQHLCICLALGLLLCSLWQAAAWGRTQLHLSLIHISEPTRH